MVLILILILILIVWLGSMRMRRKRGLRGRVFVCHFLILCFALVEEATEGLLKGHLSRPVPPFARADE
jgi:amino acid permease